MSLPFSLHLVEADKDPTQSLVSKEDKSSATKIPEQKAPALSSEENITVEAAVTKVSSEAMQLGNICTKPITESKDVKSCEISTEVPLPQLLTESLPVRTIAEQCELASPQTMQKEAPQSESLLLKAKEPQQIDSQTSILVCKLPAQEATMPITQIGSTEATPIEEKPEIPASAVQNAMQLAALISIGSPQDIAKTSPVASEAKRIIESIPDVTQPLTIDPDERYAEILLAASEISTVSPVPIQVAESVLQAEPKESVLDAAMAVSDQAIATTVTAVQESTDITSVSTPMESVQLNGSACEVERRDVMGDVAIVPDLPEKPDAPPETAKESASDLVTTKGVPSEALPIIEGLTSTVVPLEALFVKESAEQIVRTETAEAQPPEQIAKTEPAEVKPPEQITKTEAMEKKSTEQAKVETTEAIMKRAEATAQAEMTEATSTEQTETAEAAEARSPSEVPESPISEQSPTAEEPIEVKPLNIPSTPTVIEATPPISPSVESAQEMEEDAKKSLKKSDSKDGADGEDADKKAVKKTVKKVTKKPKTKSEETAPSTATESTAADGSQSKVKKTVKTTKKTGTKTLETDTSVPETPPPTPAGAVGVDAPVPPKRKTKGTNAKGTTGKKSEAEE